MDVLDQQGAELAPRRNTEGDDRKDGRHLRER